MKWYKWPYYFIAWLFPIYLLTFFTNVSTSAFLKWYYNASPPVGDYYAQIEYSVSFPPLTEKIFLLIWILGFVICCFFLVLTISGIGKSLNLGEKLFPFPAFVINQTAASALYIILGIITNHDGKLYFFTVYLRFVINEFNRDIITEKNEFLCTIVINVIITLIFTAISIFFYLREYDRQSYRLERECQRREEMKENNEKA